MILRALSVCALSTLGDLPLGASPLRVHERLMALARGSSPFFCLPQRPLQRPATPTTKQLSWKQRCCWVCCFRSTM